MYFEFEKLDVYQAALEFIERVDHIVGQLPKGYAHRKNQLQRSADSIADNSKRSEESRDDSRSEAHARRVGGEADDNIAEGVGEFAANERRRFLRISRRSALEAASQLLVISRHKQAEAELIDQTLALLHRIVCMLTKMATGTKDRRPS